MASQGDNVEILREGYEAFNERNMEAVMEVFDEDIEWHEPEGWRYGGTYHGPDEVGSVFENAFSDIEDLELDTDRFIDGGETVVVLGTLRGTATESDETLAVPFAHVHDMEDGQTTRFQQYTDTAQIERTLGD